MNVIISLVAVGALSLIAVLGVMIGLPKVLFAVVIPYLALLIFIVGFVLKIVKWAKVPVPFSIPTTCGQQKTLPWIKPNNLETPHNTWGVIGRMALEVLFFRSLFRNTKAQLIDEEKRLIYSWNMWLWLAGLAFHWSFLIVVIRHLRLFVDPTPAFVLWMQSLDGFVQVGVPTVFITSFVLLAAVTFLFVRRVVAPEVRYISLVNDYFPLFLILGIAISGVLMRHFIKVDIIAVKELAYGLITFSPKTPDVGSIFYLHIFLVCVLMAYFPFSKLMHLGGVFMSPTRNQVSHGRAKRHINPWNPEVNTHTYEEYEDEFRDKMKAVGLPLDKEE